MCISLQVKNRNTVLNCGKERTTHTNERNSEPKIKLIVDLELFLAICALIRMLGEAGTFMCEKLQDNHVFSKKARRSYAASFASKSVEGQVLYSGVYPYRKQLSF